MQDWACGQSRCNVAAVVAPSPRNWDGSMVAQEGARGAVTGDSSIKGRVIGWLLKMRLWSGAWSGGGGCAWRVVSA